MLQGGQFFSYCIQIVEIDISADDARFALRLGDDVTPGIHDHRVAVSTHARRVSADLVRSDDVNLILDRTSTQQGLPVGLSCRHRKNRGHDHDLRTALAQEPIELGETQIITDR